jgi:pyruvate,water dikinase
LAHTAKCFSSLFTGRAIAYRQRMGFADHKIAISVGVQKMVKSYAAGVLFTLNPSNGDRSSIAINSNFGFGESVVSGEVTPDEFIVNKVSLDIQSRTISKKEVFYTLDPGEQRATLADLPPERQSLQSIADEEILELARLGKAIEAHYGCPLDIEWAIERDPSGGVDVVILQARPETVWSGKKSGPVGGGGKKSTTELIMASLMAGRKIK